MKPIYSTDVHIKLFRMGEQFVLVFFDIAQNFTVQYICSGSELVALSDLIQEEVIDYVRSSE